MTALPTPAEQLAEGFALHVLAWSRRLGATPVAQQAASDAAAALSLATSQGHVCVLLDELAPGDADTLRAHLLVSGVVGTPQQPAAMPMLLDGEGRLYLHRFFEYERRLAARLVRAVGAPPSPPDAATRERLAEFFAGNAAQLGAAVDWQKVAAALALRGRLTVISGGPGTGKTTTVVNLLACLLAQQPDCRIALAAPTGKAAARMSEAIRLRAGHLPPALRERLPAQASTVHRLLGARPDGFVHHAANPLPIDVLVVDEASMLDLALATRLLDAVPEGARIVLLGDKDQLSAVEAGAVFAELAVDPSLGADCRDALADLCGVPPAALATPAPQRASPLADCCVWFTQNFRFAADSGIGRLAADINAGRAHAAMEVLRSGHDAGLRWIDEGGAQPGDAALQCMVDGYAGWLAAVRRDPGDVAGIHATFDRFRVLCAVHEGPRGMVALNEQMTRHACDALGVPADARSPWFVGRPVLVLRNDPLLQLYNGDVGITLPDAQGALNVWFAGRDGGFRAVPPLRLPAHQPAFAMTVHKAQGSEFDAVLLMLPARRSAVLGRELLYTAVTRARSQVTLVGPADVLGAAITSPTRRRSGLLARLRETLRTA